MLAEINTRLIRTVCRKDAYAPSLYADQVIVAPIDRSRIRDHDPLISVYIEEVFRVLLQIRREDLFPAIADGKRRARLSGGVERRQKDMASFYAELDAKKAAKEAAKAAARTSKETQAQPSKQDKKSSKKEKDGKGKKRRPVSRIAGILNIRKRER